MNCHYLINKIIRMCSDKLLAANFNSLLLEKDVLVMEDSVTITTKGTKLQNCFWMLGLWARARICICVYNPEVVRVAHQARIFG